MACHHVGHNFDDPFAIAVYKRTTTRLEQRSATHIIWLARLLVTYRLAAIVDGNITYCTLRDP